MNRIFLYLFISVISSCAYAQPSSINIIGMQSPEDVSHNYFVELIELALTKSQKKYGMKKLTIIDIDSSTHGRSLHLLDEKYIDMFWTGTNNQREKDFLPVRIPIFQGLLGYRISIIHKDNQKLFANIMKQPEQLKSLIACQGDHWTDSDILEDNGYLVSRTARFDLMFKMLAYKRCDYFPRAIFEGYGELAVAQKKHPDLVIFDNLLIHYPFPMYFFFHKEDASLAEQIEYGLLQAINDGSFKELMQKHPISKGLFPLKQWQKNKVISLKNNFLPINTPIDNPKFWLKIQ